jgi:hypothetical protein
MLKLNLAESSETGKRLNLERPAAQKPIRQRHFWRARPPSATGGAAVKPQGAELPLFLSLPLIAVLCRAPSGALQCA